ncbi:protein enabled homolog [Schistocerca piceifrons]|uniref:protein enabled homolog n=1 Tax=Schistocerca piceifrons TaxID=274613 RepID=UPI001F5E379F|nr:protein enabled homolog [Schistocerca piceifrons]
MKRASSTSDCDTGSSSSSSSSSKRSRVDEFHYVPSPLPVRSPALDRRLPPPPPPPPPRPCSSAVPEPMDAEAAVTPPPHMEVVAPPPHPSIPSSSARPGQVSHGAFSSPPSRAIRATAICPSVGPSICRRRRPVLAAASQGYWATPFAVVVQPLPGGIRRAAFAACQRVCHPALVEVPLPPFC